MGRGRSGFSGAAAGSGSSCRALRQLIPPDRVVTTVVRERGRSPIAIDGSRVHSITPRPGAPFAAVETEDESLGLQRGEHVRLELVEIDERVAEARELEGAASARTRKRFEERLLRSWLYHDLQLEGVALYEEDIDRALSGEEGADFCDGVLLTQIRNYRAAIDAMRRSAIRESACSLDAMFTYQHLIEPSATEDPVRNEEGASENYKHDVEPPATAMARAKKALAMLREDSGGFHPVEIAIEVHYELLLAWPLARWNAAVTRLITNQYLMTRGYPPLIVPAHDRQDYYLALNYDIRRLRRLLLSCLDQQIGLRQRFFRR